VTVSNQIQEFVNVIERMERAASITGIEPWLRAIEKIEAIFRPTGKLAAIERLGSVLSDRATD
jgi:hypothetical protein